MNLGDWLGVAGLGVSVIGFGVAIWQLVRTANASVATRKAVERTERRMAINHLLVLLPQFRIVETDLDRAAEEDDRQLASRALVSYAHFASEAAAILAGQANVDQTLVAELQVSSREASRTKGTLIDAPRTRNTKQLTKDIREHMSGLALHIGSLSANYQMMID
jgi:hypothetical protein